MSTVEQFSSWGLDFRTYRPEPRKYLRQSKKVFKEQKMAEASEADPLEGN
jgi:hypothetical protein